jgi:hypothetical protein
MSTCQYAQEICALLTHEQPAPLEAGLPHSRIHSELKDRALHELFSPHKISHMDMASACLAGIWLYHNCLDESHKISQSLPTPEGSFWHAIMHRREGDFGNSKYWFHQVGRHTVFKPLWTQARTLVQREKENPSITFLNHQREWDPFAFVDLCAACVQRKTPLEGLCIQIQHQEWKLLFDYCYRHAIS